MRLAVEPLPEVYGMGWEDCPLYEGKLQGVTFEGKDLGRIKIDATLFELGVVCLRLIGIHNNRCFIAVTGSELDTGSSGFTEQAVRKIMNERMISFLIICSPGRSSLS